MKFQLVCEKNEDAWVGVDLDKSLAEYHGWKGMTHIGKPIAAMVARVKSVLSKGVKVKIFTARADDPNAAAIIKRWLIHKAGLPPLEVTNIKDWKCDHI